MVASPLIAIAFASGLIGQNVGKPVPLNSKRTTQIQSMLPIEPGGSFPSAANREFWSSASVQAMVEPAIKRANGMLKSPLPELPATLYLEYYKNGNRTHYQDAFGKLTSRLPALTLAEAATDKGKYIPALEETLIAICKLKSWILPAHDGGHKTFDGKDMFVDLRSSDIGAQLGLAVYILRAKLSPDVVRLVTGEIHRRVIDPYLKAVDGKTARMWWMDTTNNWNAVCLAGVVGAALSSEPSIETRAKVVASSEVLIKNFLKGFTKDGYCSEGLSYWNYGYGNFLRLSEAVEQATKGKLDYLALPGAEVAGRYATRIEMTRGLAPAFADCDLTSVPSPLYLSRLARKWSWAGPADQKVVPGISDLYEFTTFAFAPKFGEPKKEESKPENHFWFSSAGVYVGHPSPGNTLSVAFKGGNNNEHHNHNDVGSYVVALGTTAMVVDPGRETYTARTFSSPRYDSNLLNSFGHSVPVINHKLQSTGADARGEILQSSFSDELDTVSFNYLSCYAERELLQLERTFTYGHKDSFVVQDTLDGKSEIRFETAIITLAEWKQINDHQITLTKDNKTLLVTIDTGGIPFTISDSKIIEDAPVKPTRIAISLNEPVRTAKVKIHYAVPEG